MTYFYIAWERHDEQGHIVNWDILKIGHDLLMAKIDMLAIIIKDESEGHPEMSKDEFGLYVTKHMTNESTEWFNGKDRYAIYSIDKD